ncbi:MAG: hypothetical protein V1776_00525 [Candidatus Diapherotrites archaeon]
MNKNKKERTVIDMPKLREAYKMENQQARELSQQMRRMEQLLIENISIQEMVKEVKGKKEVETLLPLGGGFFVKGTIKPSTFQRSLPGNVVMHSTIEEMEKETEERKKIFEKEIQLLGKKLSESRINIQNMQRLLELARRAKKERKK